MQPRPMADTSRLLFPSLRFFITLSFLLVNWALLRGCLRTLVFAPASGWNSFPSAESANEGVSVLVSEKVRSFIPLEHGVIETVATHVTTTPSPNALAAPP